jgi:murein L,D-transpeptidase YcbB/YkuD
MTPLRPDFLSYLGAILFLFIVPQAKFAVRAGARTLAAPSRPTPGQHALSSDGHAALRNFLAAAELPDLHWPNFANYQKEAKEFYDAAGDALPWIDNGKPSAQARAVIQSLKNAADKGLRPEDYDGGQWDERLARFDGPAAPAESDLVKFDLALTVCAMRYISDLHMGRVNPRLFHFGLDINHQQIDLSEFLRQNLVRATDVSAVLETVEPPFPIYRLTQDALMKYTKLARLDDGERLPVSERAIKPGDAYAGVPRLAKLLALLGDLPPESEGASAAGNYEGALVDAVTHFQQRHGLDPSGLLDTPTLRELNAPLSRRVAQLQLALERMRWLPHEFSRPPIVVNIPEFRLYAVNEKYLTVFTMKAVVGKAYGHQTPVFSNEIKSVILRPYWNVPQSIVDAELIPHLEKDPSYLSENSYEIVDKDERVVVEGLVSNDVMEQLHVGKLRVRQTPGPENALGLIKFEFPNQYDVYMHGTPARELFSRTRRDFSHGCIRLEDPVKLASWVLQGMPDWTEEKIRSAMNADTTVEIKLKEPMPVLIFYSTAVVLEGEEPHFFHDIYALDADLIQVLAQHVP